MFRKFDYGNLNCVFTRVYASLSNKYKSVDYLAKLSDGLSLNINSDSLNFKWKLLEALPIKVKQEESSWWLFEGSVFLWQLGLCHYILMVSQLELTFPNVHIGLPERFVSPT